MCVCLVTKSCPMLYVPMDCSLPSSSVHGILPWLDSPMDRFSRPEYWSGLLFPSLGDLSDPGIEPMSPALQADSPGKWNNGLFCLKSGGRSCSSPSRAFLRIAASLTQRKSSSSLHNYILFLLQPPNLCLSTYSTLIKGKWTLGQTPDSSSAMHQLSHLEQVTLPLKGSASLSVIQA